MLIYYFSIQHVITKVPHNILSKEQKFLANFVERKNDFDLLLI